jgi:hypothetical protein
MEFTACKYLDFSDSYTAKKQVLGSGKVFWLRDVNNDKSIPAMVQFCTKRGRLNNPEACTSEKLAVCSDYEDFKHNVPDDSIADYTFKFWHKNCIYKLSKKQTSSATGQGLTT